MAFQVSQAVDDPRTLTQVVLQIVALLDMYQAELARVLEVNCGDIGELASGRQMLEPGTHAWEQALLFVRFYRGLYNRMQGEGVAMRHWLRVEKKQLLGIPQLLIVDEKRLEELVDHVEDESLWQ